MDFYNIERRLKTIDKDFMINQNLFNGDYYITCRGKNFMTVKYNELDDRVVKHVRKVVYINKYGDILQDVNNCNDKEESKRLRELEHTFQCMSEDIKPYVGRLKYDS